MCPRRVPDEVQVLQPTHHLLTFLLQERRAEAWRCGATNPAVLLPQHLQRVVQQLQHGLEVQLPRLVHLP